MKIDSGRIETFLALGILVAVIVLFAKFYRPAVDAPVPPPVIEAPATTASPAPSN
jgi:hypothetical protein